MLPQSKKLSLETRASCILPRLDTIFFSSNISIYTPPQSMLLSKNAQFLTVFMYEQIGSLLNVWLFQCEGYQRLGSPVCPRKCPSRISLSWLSSLVPSTPPQSPVSPADCPPTSPSPLHVGNCVCVSVDECVCACIYKGIYMCVCITECV